MLRRILGFFKRLLRRDQSAPPSSDPLIEWEQERRAEARQPSLAQVMIWRVSGQDAIALRVRVRNVSPRGIHLFADERFEPGEMINVQVPSPVQDSNVLACVIHARQVTEEEWALGCAFSDALEVEELVAFGVRDAKPPGPADERRSDRVACNLRLTIEHTGAKQSGSRAAVVINLSTGGVAFLADQPLATGALLNLVLENPAAAKSRAALGCVVHVTSRQDGTWRVGCNFIRALSENDLRELL